jgi:hypothetical protein
MNRLLSLSTSLLTLSLVLSSCSGKSGSSSVVASPSPSPLNQIQSQIIDSPVKGLNYTLGADPKMMTTGENGAFACNLGEMVHFYIAKNTPMGKGVCSEKIFISQLGMAPGEVETTAAALIAIAKVNDPMFNPNNDVPMSMDVGGYTSPYSASPLNENNLSGSLNSFLSGLNPEEGHRSVPEVSSTMMAMMEAMSHIQQSLSLQRNGMSDVLVNWLNIHSQSVIDLSDVALDSSSDVNSCPADLSGVSLAIRNTGSGYTLNVNVGEGSSVFSTPILSERLATDFSIFDPLSERQFVGVVSIKLSGPLLNQADGVIHFSMNGESRCNYNLSHDFTPSPKQII